MSKNRKTPQIPLPRGWKPKVRSAVQTGRRAYLMELDAPYCDVIVQRFENFSGKKAQRITVDNEAGEVPA